MRRENGKERTIEEKFSDEVVVDGHSLLNEALNLMYPDVQTNVYAELAKIKAIKPVDHGYNVVKWHSAMESKCIAIEQKVILSKCVCLCLLPTCQKCCPGTSATFCYVSQFFSRWHRVGDHHSRHTFLDKSRNLYSTSAWLMHAGETTNEEQTRNDS